jgi:hypothetical protein
MVLGGRCPQTYKINYWAMGCSEKMKYYRKEEQEIVRSMKYLITRQAEILKSKNKYKRELVITDY